MKNYLKDKRVMVGLALVAGVFAYYYYDKNRKANIKAKAEVMADTPVGGTSASLGPNASNTPPIVKATINAAQASKADL